MPTEQDPSDPTGVSGTSGSKNEVTRARQRKSDAALALRTAGSTWDEIASLLGYPSGRHALVSVEGALGRRLNELDREKLRVLASDRLESLLRSTWPKAHNRESPEHLAAVGKAREVVNDYRKLWGLDAPTEVIIATPTQTELDNWVARVVGNNLPAVTEYDVVEGEVIDSEDPDAVA